MGDMRRPICWWKSAKPSRSCRSCRKPPKSSGWSAKKDSNWKDIKPEASVYPSTAMTVEIYTELRASPAGLDEVGNCWNYADRASIPITWKLYSVMLIVVFADAGCGYVSDGPDYRGSVWPVALLHWPPTEFPTILWTLYPVHSCCYYFIIIIIIIIIITPYYHPVFCPEKNRKKKTAQLVASHCCF